MPNWLHKCSYTCWLTHAPKMIPSPAASYAACSGGILDSIIKLKKRDRATGLGEEKKLDWVEKNNRELRKLSGQRRVSLPSDSRSESSSSWNPCSRAWQSTRKMNSAVQGRSGQYHLHTEVYINSTSAPQHFTSASLVEEVFKSTYT